MARARQLDRRVPALRLLALHGAGSGPWVFDGWEADVVAPDLQAGLDVATATMTDYAEAAVRAADGLERPFTLVGWSMGGLVAMMASARIRPARLVLIEPSPPGEVQGFHGDVPLVGGIFDPEDLYGPFPVRPRPESALARAERKRGISVPSLPCPTLVVTGDDFREERGAVAEYYDADVLDLPNRDHWELVLGKETSRRVVWWAGCSTGLTTDSSRPTCCALSAGTRSERSPRGNAASRSSG